ncbi:Carbonic anhydrase [Bartonella clarridgeiae 73]|uniref:Carbonic anhydrase n=1 Tax=Bartonella clarridgeiae (strain CCUG 45776 / CIP 104772 / 73) TaxID=696125 RepID=E6YJF7_BARC7|nr:carbonic anhydrase [Bartonella clarridgeiae]CBI76995.1 Carbonic anhydrase [Bartonella clarridgeiae 73]
MARLPEKLLRGYQSFITNHFVHKLERYWQLANEGQKPETLVIACCDSRAIPEIIFDASPGEIFVLRNVANLVPPFSPDHQYHATSAAIEFAVQLLEVKHVVILGHAHCGGISKVLNGTCKSLLSDDFIGRWMSLLAPAREAVINNKLITLLEKQTALERLSIRYSLKNLETFPWLKARKDQGFLTVHGAWFDIASGELWSMEQETGDFVRVESGASAQT